jgi:hypothetical protein
MCRINSKRQCYILSPFWPGDRILLQNTFDRILLELIRSTPWISQLGRHQSAWKFVLYTLSANAVVWSNNFVDLYRIHFKRISKNRLLYRAIILLCLYLLRWFLLVVLIYFYSRYYENIGAYVLAKIDPSQSRTKYFISCREHAGSQPNEHMLYNNVRFSPAD